MRLLNSASCAIAALAALSGVLAAPSPNFEISKTHVDIDKHRQSLDNGDVIVRVQRTDELFSDPDDQHKAKLLLEKDTHILLKIHLDADAGKVTVNDYVLDILKHIKEGDDAPGTTIKGVQSDIYRLPRAPSGPVLSGEERKTLMDQLSVGIAKVEVRLVSEMGPASTFPMAMIKKGQDEGKANLEIETMSFRRIALAIRITEVEGKEVSHAHSIFTPIVQLIATTSSVEIGGLNKPVVHRLHTVKTLAIDGKAPLEVDAVAHPLNSVSLDSLQALPSLEKEHPHDPAHGRHPSPPHRHHREEHGFFGWLAHLFGLGPSDRHPHGPHHGGRRPGCQKWRKEHDGEGRPDRPGRLATHRPMSENPFSGLMEEPEEGGPKPEFADFVKSEGLPGMGGAPVGALAHRRPAQHHDGDSSHHRHPHGHRNGSNGMGTFFRDLAFGFVTGIAMVASLLVHPIAVLFAGSFCFFLLLGKYIVQRVQARRADEGTVALADEQEKETSSHDNEKVTLKEVLVLEKAEQNA